MQWFVGHPHHCRLELVGGLRRTVRKRNDIAARAIDLVGEADRHRFPGDSLILTSIRTHKRRDLLALWAPMDDALPEAENLPPPPRDTR